MLEEVVKEMKCFNCIHAPVCFIQKGGVNLQLVDSTDCEYYQQKTSEDSVLISKEELLEIANDYEEMAMFHLVRQGELDQVRTQTIQEVLDYLNTRMESDEHIFQSCASKIVCEDYILAREDCQNDWKKWLSELAKEFGVESKE